MIAWFTAGQTNVRSIDKLNTIVIWTEQTEHTNKPTHTAIKYESDLSERTLFAQANFFEFLYFLVAFFFKSNRNYGCIVISIKIMARNKTSDKTLLNLTIAARDKWKWHTKKKIESVA